ncbi:WD repeat-containing protein 87-like [Lynx rufus]|uniref:WD repeat-containing protein 87-like n=1 Tax=Lynx rufus TaxID=61384 RepID=UPI001F124D3D|nr:WD repeat-containing protein 87-like [Lynx rufus]
MAPSPRLIPEWKDLKLFINNMLKDLKSAEKPKNEVIVLSDWPEAVLWIQKKDTEAEGTMEKMVFCVMDQVPPIEAMVHTGSYHMLVAYCGDMHLWLFGDHHRAFISLGTVPCRFFISCLCYDPETEVLLSGTLGAVVTWLILPNGRDLQMAQTVPMSGHELVQGFSLNGPKGSLLALCENKVRVFTHQGQGQLKEVRKFTPIGSGSSITCSFTCVSQGYFYAGNKDGEIHAWGLDQGNFLHSFQAHSSSVICVHSRPEIHTLLTAGREGTVREWNLAVGNLLRQLDIGEGLRQLQFIDNTTFFCQTTHAFSLHHLPYFYSLFNVCGSAPEQVHRVCCGRNWTRILCATKDGLLRFLSPVTGDLLVLTWPLLVMDKAVAWAYDPDNEELFVATGSSEVLVFDATRSPCTAKYMVCTSVNSRDRVSCLAYAQSHLGMGLVGLMFCGHDSGIVRILSHYSYARIEKTVHSGAVLALSTLEGPQENSLLCSYGMDNTVYLTEALLWKNKVILQSISKILCSCPLQHVILLPGSVGAITDNHCWRLWHYQDFLQSAESKQSSMFEETKCLHRCAITSFDVCSSLKLFVTGGIDGSVRIWDFHGRLITELDSALHFGPLCFANNRGDLLLTFNQSLYLVSCLKLLPPARLIHLAILNNADEIQEDPKLFLPSFFFSFEIVLVPKFVYLGQGLQELQGLEALVNKRVIAFDNTVPHVIEEERRMPSLIQVEPKLHFLEDKDIAFSIPDPKHNHPPHVVPAQLRLAGWNGLNPYHKLHGFFGKGRQWPFAPDGYIPNSVIRACLWPDGTPVFLRHDLYPSYRDTDWDMTEPIRRQTLSPMPLSEENISMRRERDKSKWWKRTFYDVLTSLINRNWAGRKLDEGLLNNLIEAILSLTVYCSIDQYTTYISALAQIFATYQVSPRLCSETACRLLEDTLHPNPCIRELAWEGLDMLGIMSHLFAVPLSLGLMDSDENVRAKALYLMIRVTGIQSKSMLVGLLKEQETLQKMQRELIGETSLDQLLGIQANDIQCLLTRVEQQLNENLTLSHRDQQPPFSLDISMDGEPETFVKRTFIPEEITKRKKRMTYVPEKRESLIKKDLRVSRKKRETELVKFSSMLVPSEDEGEQREAKKSELIDTEDVALEPELPLSTFSPAKSEEVAESKEVMTEATEAMEATEEGRGHMAVTEAVEATQIMRAIDQHDMKDYGEIFPKLERQELMKRLWERAVEKSHEKVAAKLKQKEKLKDISKTTAKEPKEKVMQIAEQEKDTRKKLGKGGQGLAGAPGHTGESDTRSWRNDICYLATSRIASSHPGMLRDLGQELVDLARVILAPQEPSWDLFQKICPLLKDSSELEERVVEEPSTITEKVDKEIVEEEVTELGRQRGKEALEKDKAFSQVKKKKVAFLDKLALQKRKLKKEARGLARQDGKIAEEERKLSKPEKKLIQGERKRVTQKEGRAALKRSKWDWEKINKMAHEEDMWPQEEVLPVWGERKLSQEEEELGEEDEELSEEEEEPCEEEKEFSEEEPSEEEEELAWDEEELILDLKKQVKGRKKKSHKKKKHIQGIEKHVEEEAQKRGELAQEEEHLSGEEEGLSGEEEKQKADSGEEEKAGGMKKWSQEEKKQAREEKRRDQKEEKLAQKVEKQAEDKKQWAREKMKLVPGEEKKIEEIEKVFPQKEKRAMVGEKQAKKEEKWVGKDRKATDKKEQQTHKKEQLALQEQIQAQEERIWGQKEENESEKKNQRAWVKEKIFVEREEHAGEVEKKSQKNEEKALKKRLTQKDSELANEKRHIAKRKKAVARKGIGITKRKKKTEEEKEVVEEEELSQEERELAYDIRIKEMGVAKKKRKRTKEERIQAVRKLDMEKGIRSEDKEASSSLKDIRKKESNLFRILAKTIRKMSIVLPEETEICEEERSFMTGKSEMDGQKWEFFKEQGEIMKEEKELGQEEGKVEDDRLATKERTLTDGESLKENRKLLQKVQGKILLDRVQEESLSQEEEESLSQEEEESLSQEEEESLSQEEEESLSQEEEESLSQEEEESLSQEEEESLSQEEEESLSQEEEESLSQEEEESLSQGVLKTELSKEEVSLSKLTIEDESLAEKRKGTTIRKMPFKKERLLDGQRDPTLRDKVMWPTVLKSPFKMPLPVALEKQRMPRKVLGDHLDLKGQESQLLGAHPETSSWRRQEDVLLKKARGMFLQGRGTGLQAQIPEGLHRPESHLSDMIRKPQKPEHRPKGDMWKWFLKSRDLPMGKTEGQVVGPALASAPSLTSAPAERPCYSEASFSDEDWINNALIRLEAGEQLSRNSFQRLHQLLRNFTSKGYLKWMHLYNLKAIAKHFRKNLEVSHADISQPYKDVLSPVHLKGIPPIRRKEKWSRLEPFPEALPIPSPVFPSATKRIPVPKAINWHLLGEPYRSAQVQQLSNAVKEMEMQHFYPIAREIFTGAHDSVDKQTLALMFQKDLRAFKGKDRPLTLPKLKKAQPVSKKQEKLPQWETFVALYYVLRTLQQRYAKDRTAWMEQFCQLMDLYQFKSPQIQRLLLQLLQREALQPQETIYKKALKAKELVLGERLFCGLFCGHSCAPAGPLKFHDVVPLPGKSKVHTIQPVGIAQYGFLELAWKSLPQVSPYLIERLPNISTPTL